MRLRLRESPARTADTCAPGGPARCDMVGLSVPAARPYPQRKCYDKSLAVQQQPPASPDDKSRWDPLLACLLRDWLNLHLDASWPVDWGYRAPPELCQKLRADAAAAFANQDLAAVYEALAAFQKAVAPLFYQAHPKPRTLAFRFVWWPNTSRCLLWKTQPEAPCPACAGRHFWRVDARGFVCEKCCPAVACEPVERFTFTQEKPDATLPGKLIWWHKNALPPTWRLKEYASMNDPAPYPVESSVRWSQWTKPLKPDKLSGYPVSQPCPRQAPITA